MAGVQDNPPHASLPKGREVLAVAPLPLPFTIGAASSNPSVYAVEFDSPVNHVDHSRRERNKKRRPNQQRDNFEQYALAQLRLATEARPEAVRAARSRAHTALNAPVSTSVEFEYTDNIAPISSLSASLSPSWIEKTGLSMATIGTSLILVVHGARNSSTTIPAPLADSGAPSSTFCAASMNPACAPTLDFPGWNFDEDSVDLDAAQSLFPDDTEHILYAGLTDCSACQLRSTSACPLSTSTISSGNPLFPLAPICAVSPVRLLTAHDLGPCGLAGTIYTRSSDDLHDLDTLPSNLFVEATVNGYPVAAIADSGALVTLIHSSVYESIPESDRPLLERSKLALTSASSDTTFAVRGSAVMSISVAGTTGTVAVTVCDNLMAQCLLGCDFMLRYGVTPCLMDLCVKSRHGSSPFYAYKRTMRGNRILFVDAGHYVSPAFSLPAWSISDVSIPFPARLGDQPVLIEPSSAAVTRGVVAARVVTQPVNGKLRLRLLNISPTSLSLTDHDPIAMFTLDFHVDSTGSASDSNTAVLSGDQASSVPIGSVASLAATELQPESPAASCVVDAILELLDMTDSVFAPGKPHHAAFRAFLADFADRFAMHPDDYGRTPILQHRIDTDPYVTPIYQRARPVPLRCVEEVKREIDGMLRAGIVTPSQSEWSSPIVIVRKKDGGLRLCVDYRALNDVTVKDSFPLPRINELLDRLHGARLFTSLDLQKGFHQIVMEESSRCKTAFAVPWGLFEYQVMPFGVCNGPSTCQRLITLALQDCIGVDCVAFIDDILTYALDPDDMIVHLRRVFRKLRVANLKVKPQKCTFGRSAVDFLGHHVTADGITPMDSKLDAIYKACAPRTITELRAFLGLTNYYRDYIVHYATISDPLYVLLRKGTPWFWEAEQDAAFQALKNAFRSAPLLAHPNDNDLFILDTDASLEGIGAVLSQVQQGKERVVCCGSRVLTPAERNYDTTRRELLAIVYFVNRFRHYLYGAQFVLRTDHAALRWLFHTPEQSGQAMRWITKLADFHMLVVHRPGHLHANADALSRRPLLLVDGCLSEAPTSAPVAVPIAVVLAKYGQPPSDLALDQLLDQSTDASLSRALQAVISNTWPDRAVLVTLPADFRAFAAQRALLHVHNNRLWYRRPHLLNSTTPVDVLVVPRQARSSVIAECHDARASAHFAERKTLLALRQRFWWPGLRADVRLYCRLCETCQLCAKRVAPGHAPMQSFDAGAPWEVVGMDFIGPMPPTARRYRYILTIVDHFTRLTVLVPIRKQTTEATIDAVVDKWIAYYGVPRILHSDRGANFTSALMIAICERLGVQKTQTTAYRPQADGRVERTNRTVKECLTRLLREHSADWDQLLPQVAMAINSTIHESTGFSPFFLAHGVAMQLPVDLVLPPPTPYPAVTPYVDAVLHRFELAYALARTTLLGQTERAKRRYDAQARTIHYAVGDKVYYAKHIPAAGDHPKFHAVWTGPCTVLQLLGDVNLQIRHDIELWIRVVHVDRVTRQHSDPDDDHSDLPDDDDLDVPTSVSSNIPEQSDSSVPLSNISVPVRVLHPSVPSATVPTPLPQ